MPSNGDVSANFGVYRALCCDAEIVIGVGAVFPDCPNHRKLPTMWKQVPDVDPATYTLKPGRIKPAHPPPQK
jgi:hypothetical protein